MLLFAIVAVLSFEPPPQEDVFKTLDSNDIRTEFRPLWPCPKFENEFEAERCKAARPAADKRIRSLTYAAVGRVELGEFDFARKRFPLTVWGMAFGSGVPDDLLPTDDYQVQPALGPTGEVFLLSPGPIPVRGDALPSAWVIDRTFASFDDLDAAEAFRNDASKRLVMLLLFRVTGTWKVRIPASQIERNIFGSRAKGENAEGVRIRPVGYFVMDLGEPGGCKRMLASSLIGSKNDVVAAAVLAHANAQKLRCNSSDGTESPGAEPRIKIRALDLESNKLE